MQVLGSWQLRRRLLLQKMVTSTGNCLPVWLSVASPVCLFIPEPLSWVLACWQGTWRAGWSASAVARHSPCMAGQWLPLTWFLTSTRPLRTFSIDCTGSKEGPVASSHRIMCTKTSIAPPLWHKPGKGQQPCLRQKGSKKTAWWNSLASGRKVQRRQHGELPQAFGARTTKQNRKTCDTKRQAISLKRNIARLSSLCRNCMVVRRFVAYFMCDTFQRWNVWVIIISLHARLNHWCVFSLLQLRGLC